MYLVSSSAYRKRRRGVDNCVRALSTSIWRTKNNNLIDFFLNLTLSESSKSNHCRWIKLAVKLLMLHSVMVQTRNLIRDEVLGAISDDDDDSPSGKRSKLDRFPLSRWELAVSLGVFLVFSSSLFCIYITMPAAKSGKLKLPRSISDLRLLK